ncbi:MAG: putative selenate reductase subunit YgfK [Cellulosilyticaceae bacterium]
MNDRMTPIPFDQLMSWILADPSHILGIKQPFKCLSTATLPLFEEELEVPFGPAAGPHTQLAQNIITAYVAGARFFELKTVQTLDGEDLPVAKPCIHAEDECYNVEWSTELTVSDAFDEYAKAWFALKLLAQEFSLGNPDGFIFNMSVGYDLEGIQSSKINTFIENLKDAHQTPIWQTCQTWALEHLHLFSHVDEDYITSISPYISRSITLSTLHGCPSDTIESIATYLLEEKKLHTYIKCNPTLLGYTFVRQTLDTLGYDYLVFDDYHFNHDLQYSEAIPMLTRLLTLSQNLGLSFGVKLTNTFPVKITTKELPGEEMYMSGRSLFPLTISLAAKLAKTFEGHLPISFSGGADAFNITQLFDTGIYPITLATTLLKPGGYSRLSQLAHKLIVCDYTPPNPLDVAAIESLAQDALLDTHYRKPIKPLASRKITQEVPLLDCTFAPCSKGCPIAQDIPEYIRLVGEGDYLGALKVITDKNPLPFITGTLCNHNCMSQCRRTFYEESVSIREVKRIAAEKGFDQFITELTPPAIRSQEKVAIVGGGPAGLATAYFLAREGMDVTIFEKRKALGGIIHHVIPSFRIYKTAIHKDIRLVEKLGVTFKLGHQITSLDALHADGFTYIVTAIGAWKPGQLLLEAGEALNALDFLTRLKASPKTISLGENVVVIGGGNTAMDTARAAKRVPGVQNVSLVYRRTKRYMPADEEELTLALADGIDFKELLSPVAYQDGHLSCQKMKLGSPDTSGRRAPIPTDEWLDIPADTVLAAVGDQVDDAFFTANHLALNAKGKIASVSQHLEISPNIFIAGDALNGPATVVEAIRDARLVADEILTRAQLTPVSDLPPSTALNYVSIYDKKGLLQPASLPHVEHHRCLNCDKVCECCVDVCPNRANVTILSEGKPQILHLDRLCNACGNCTIFCPYASAPYLSKFTLFHSLEAFETSDNPGYFILDTLAKRLRVRLAHQVFETTLDNWEHDPAIHSLITAIFKDYAYLL